MNVNSYPNSLALLDSPGERQSKELMEKVMPFIIDEDSGFVSDTILEKRLKNGSRVVSLPGTEETVRGYSAPRFIAIDEAARCRDELYTALRPMMTAADTILVLLSTPAGRRGFFYDTWTRGVGWTKIMVKAPCDIVDGELVPPVPEEFFTAMWREKGVHAFYSPRHTFKELQDEFRSMPEYWFRAEYLCEFTESTISAFRGDDIDWAFSAGADGDLKPLFEETDEYTNDQRIEPFDWQDCKRLVD